MPKSEVRMLNGYRVIYKPEYSRAMTNKCWEGYVYEHIFVAEERLGRSLRDDEVTHHLDGNRSNNRSENIITLLRSQHMKLHSWLDKGAPFLKENGCNGMNSGKSVVFKPCCKICGITLQHRQKLYCSEKCYIIGKRSVLCPPKEQLEKDINSMSYCAIGRKYGVSDNAVRKWARKYGIL